MARDKPTKRPKRRNLKNTVELDALLGPIGDSVGKRQKKEKRQKVVSKKAAGVGQRVDVEDSVREDIADFTDERVEEKIAFCCKICRCPDYVKKDFPSDDNEIQLSRDTESSNWHRRCCHRISHDVDVEDWLPQIGYAVQAMEFCFTLQPKKDDDDEWELPVNLYRFTGENMIGEKKDLEDYSLDCEKGLCVPIRTTTESSIVKEPIETVHEAYLVHKSQVTSTYNKDEELLTVDLIQSIPHYATLKENFERRVQIAREKKKENKPDLSSAVVLDLFGGIGAGIVVLKRLGISIKKIIHVEHDKVANAVFEKWHGPIENLNENEQTFEWMEREFDVAMERWGPIDIIIAGPPCIDYALCNAHRKGPDGRQGSYMLRTAALIQKIAQFNQAAGQEDPLFLVENVVLSNTESTTGSTESDLKRVTEAFGDTGVLFAMDSADITPLRRNRTYITNIPLNENPRLFDPPPKKCFEDGWNVAGPMFDENLYQSKAQGLMASKGQLDKFPRMAIYKESDVEGVFLKRAPTVREREKLMGLPSDYVSKPLNELFPALLTNGLSAGYGTSTHWKEELPNEFHKFAGDYNGFEGIFRSYQFYIQYDFETNMPEMKLMMAPPKLYTKGSNPGREKDLPKPSYYSMSEYGKRLIGNSFSIPTLEELLNPIAELFARKDYGPTYNESFAWTGWSNDRLDPISPSIAKFLTNLVADPPSTSSSKTGKEDDESSISEEDMDV